MTLFFFYSGLFGLLRTHFPAVNTGGVCFQYTLTEAASDNMIGRYKKRKTVKHPRSPRGRPEVAQRSPRGHPEARVSAAF